MKKYIIEFIGTFFLVFTFALSGNPIAVAAILTAMVYMGGYISGAHYNPAVTLAVLLRGKIALKEALGYMLSQVLAGAAAAGIFWLMAKSPFIPQPGEGLSLGLAYATEILFTFALASVVLHVATSDKVKDNYYYGIAIGLTVLAGGFAAGQISGGVFNPAIGLAPILMDYTHLKDNLGSLVLYLVAPLAGGLLAAAIYRLTSREVSKTV